MRAERDRRATILTAEGVKQSAILTAEGEKQSSILRGRGCQAQAAILKAQGEARAILQVFDAIHHGNPDSKLLAYQYLQVLPQIAQGASNKVWIVPTELTRALSGIGAALGGESDGSAHLDAAPGGVLPEAAEGVGGVRLDEPVLEDPSEALRKARDEAAGATAEAERSTQRSRGLDRRGGGVGGGGGGGTAEPPPAPPEGDAGT